MKNLIRFKFTKIDTQTFGNNKLKSKGQNLVFCPFLHNRETMIIFLDTETTGLRPGKICQLSYVMQSGKNVKEKNFFFSVDFVEYGALKVHGFSVPILRGLSNGKVFADHVDEIEKDFNEASLIVAHNTSFDFMFLRAEFERANRFFNSEKGFCSMKKTLPICKILRSNHAGYKYPKLAELCEFLDISNSQIQTKTVELFGNDCGFHDARFDTTALFLAVNKLADKYEDFYFLKELEL